MGDNNANVWRPSTQTQISGNTKSVEELLIAAANQVLFTLTKFTYVVGTGAVEVHKNGLLLNIGVDWVETTTSTISLTSPAAESDKVTVTGKVGISGSLGGSAGVVEVVAGANVQVDSSSAAKPVVSADVGHMEAVAHCLNIPVSDLGEALTGRLVKGYLYDAEQQQSFLVPKAALGDILVSVNLRTLTTNNGVYQLLTTGQENAAAFYTDLLAAAGIVDNNTPDLIGASQYLAAMITLINSLATGAGAYTNVTTAKQANHTVGTVVSTLSYAVAGDGFGAQYLVMTAEAFGVTPDGWGDHETASGDVLVLLPEFGAFSAGQCGVKGDGTNELLAIYAFEARLYATRINGLFHAGTFNIVDANFPFRNTVNPTVMLKDYSGVTVRGQGKGSTVFKTSSVAGADVLQLNAVKGLTVLDLSVTTELTGVAGSGSNGVSVTNGGENIYVDVDCFGCAGVDKGAYMDGGKGFTIQPASTGNPLKNVTLKGRADNCVTSFEFSATFEQFNSTTRAPYAGIKVDVLGTDCWRGVVLSSTAAVVAASTYDLDCDLEVKATLIDCAQPYVDSRFVRAVSTIHVTNRKIISQLLKPLAADQTVVGAVIVGSFRSKVSIVGRMAECDNKLRLGGTTQGGGLSGATDELRLHFDLECPLTIDDEVILVDSGGNTVTRGDIMPLIGITDGSDSVLRQKWQAPARVFGVTYTNDTGLPIQVIISKQAVGPGTRTLTVDGYPIDIDFATGTNDIAVHSVVIPDGSEYVYNANFDYWSELR